MYFIYLENSILDCFNEKEKIKELKTKKSILQKYYHNDYNTDPLNYQLKQKK